MKKTENGLLKFVLKTLPPEVMADSGGCNDASPSPKIGNKKRKRDVAEALQGTAVQLHDSMKEQFEMKEKAYPVGSRTERVRQYTMRLKAEREIGDSDIDELEFLNAYIEKVRNSWTLMMSES